jgi:DNA processing protein
MRKEILISYFPKITFTRYQSLIRKFHNLDSAWKAEFSDFGESTWEENIIHEFLLWKEKVDEEALEKTLEKENIQPVFFTDENYPPLLREIHDPPLCLFIRGNIENISYPIAIVGTRKSTSYGRQVSEEIIKDLVSCNMTIVSGLALGIDGICHEATLKEHGRTIAVLGSGVDKNTIYPSLHKHLAEKIIASGGAVISEYPPYSKASIYSFPRRNRIIAAMTMGTLVIEAQESSGSLITAQCALEYNREVFAIPQNIHSPTAAGPNNIIKMGARPVTESQDILNIFNLQKPTLLESEKQIGNTPEETLILQTLSREPTHIDAIIKNTHMSSSSVLGTLTILEIKGKVRNLGSQNYILNI